MTNIIWILYVLWGPIKGKLLKFHITKMFEYEPYIQLSAKQFVY
jgi:hypothetical protein